MPTKEQKEEFWKARRENDRTAPRMRKGKYTNQLVSKELYNEWLKTTEFKDLDFRTFKIVWEMIAYVFREEVANNMYGVRLPFYTGDLKLAYVPAANMAIDQKASNEVGKNLPYMNWTKDAKPGKIIWSVDHARKRNRYCTIFGFEAAREFKERAAQGFLKNPEKYRDNKWKNFNFISRKELLSKYGIDYYSKKDVKYLNGESSNDTTSNVRSQEGTEGN